jgi:hypothetical protein
MYILYVSIIILGFSLGIYIGLKMFSKITHPIIYNLSWIVYIATLITFLNMIATGIFHMTLQNKRGPVGLRGQTGDTGNDGDTGKCDSDCNKSICVIKIKSYIEKIYNKMLNQDGLSIDNKYINEKIKQMCYSQQAKEVSKLKSSKDLINYLGQTWKKWFDIMYQLDTSEEKDNFKNWFQRYQTFDEYLDGKASQEIKKYDVYHWGMSRLFKPQKIEFCSDPAVNKEMIQGENPSIKAILSNYYEKIWDDRGSGIKMNVSFYRPKMITYKNRKYYPLGDILLPNKHNGENSKRYFREFEGNDMGEHNNIDLNITDNGGPSRPTILVNSDSRFVQPPKKYIKVWDEYRHRSRRSRIQIWKPLDFTSKCIDGKERNFKCLGVISGWGNPNEKYKNNPESTPIRCIAEDILETVPKKEERVWTNRNYNKFSSGVKRFFNISRRRPSMFSSGHENKDPSYTEYYYTKVNNDPLKSDGSDYYRIKPSSFVKIDPPNIEYNDDKSIGWHGDPIRNPKYSINSFLDNVPESIITNLESNIRYLLVNAKLHDKNLYTIHYYNRHTDDYKLCLLTKGDYVYRSGKCDLNNDHELWIVIFPKNTKDFFLLKNKATGKYLESVINQSKLSIPIERNTYLNQSDIDSGNVSDKFKWGLQKSATGNTF